MLVGDREVGVLAVEHHPEALFISNIAITPEQQGRDLGAAIIGDVLAAAARANVATGLQVPRINPARRLYERLGFAIERETPTHYLLRRAAGKRGREGVARLQGSITQDRDV